MTDTTKPTGATGLRRWTRLPYCDDYLAPDPDGELVEWDDVDALLAELEPLANIGRLAVEEHKAYLAFLDAGTDDQVANDALVVAQEAVDVAITSYRAAQAEGKEGE